MSERRENINGEGGFTLIELAVAMLIIGILAAVAVTNFTPTKVQLYDTVAQDSLRSVFNSCKDYWTFNSSQNPCSLSTLSSDDYLFKPPADVKIMIEENINNTEYDFHATASHTGSTNVFAIDYHGTISQTKSESSRDNQNDQGQDQNDQGQNQQ